MGSDRSDCDFLDAALGDAATISCPWCAQPTDIFVDVSGGEQQSYVEDCVVCCRPIRVQLRVRHGEVHVWSEADS